jgi:hypothetical protein
MVNLELDSVSYFLNGVYLTFHILGHEFHKVTGILPRSKLFKGIRSLVYEIAIDNVGFYNGKKEDTIFYVENDLHVAILFDNRAGCVRFVNQLSSRLRHFQLLDNFNFSHEFKILSLQDYPPNIFVGDYNSDDFSSQAYSITNTRVTHISNLTNISFETELQMIENPNHEDFVGLACYKCHLKSKAEFKQDIDNPNNCLWMSWSTHQRFDGLNTVGKHRVPQIAIKFISRTGFLETFENVFDREKVEIAIECPDDDVFGVMRNRVKPGSVVDEKSNTIMTWVFVENAAEFEQFLIYKYEETKFCWNRFPRNKELNNKEAHELRRSARIAADGKTTVVKKK